MSESFEKFQTEEYSNISKAHFETNTQIATFFRYFLLIASAPAGIFIWYEKKENLLEQLFAGQIPTNTTLFIGFFLIFIAVIGTLTCFYLMSFRLDSVLYARTVNGIRKYYYEKEQLVNETHYRVLPKQINQPKYSQKHTFSMVVWCIGLINSVYFAVGTKIIAVKGEIFFSEYIPTHFWIFPNYNFLWAIAFGTGLFIAHIFYYVFISDYRNFSYMKTLTIGVDIDGVLNKHRETFCTYLWENSNHTKSLWADQITVIPVHLIPDKEIKQEDEAIVFNDPDYWVNQIPIEENIGNIIKELRNKFGYKIRIFSYRAWPDLSFIKDDKKTEYFQKWLFFGRNNTGIARFLFNNIRINSQVDRLFRYRTIHQITKKWLNTNHIPFDSLIIEKAGLDKNPSKSILYRLFKTNFKNRFFYSRKYSYRYFIEDDVKNAIKLAASCEYVFLIDHPYNRNYDGRFVFPSNIIRVSSWSEIKERIKDLG